MSVRHAARRIGIGHNAPPDGDANMIKLDATSFVNSPPYLPDLYEPVILSKVTIRTRKSKKAKKAGKSPVLSFRLSAKAYAALLDDPRVKALTVSHFDGSFDAAVTEIIRQDLETLYTPVRNRTRK